MKTYLSTMAFVGVALFANAQSQPNILSVANKDRTLKFPYDSITTADRNIEEQMVAIESTDYLPKDNKETKKQKKLMAKRSESISRSKAYNKVE